MSKSVPAAAVQDGAHQLRTRAALGALGIVYGDIGTSPLYALKEAAKAAGGGGTPTPDAILGVLSLMLWSLILIISLKYAILILRADNRGEGGIVALLALLHAREAPPRSWRAYLLILGLIGAALLYGDGAITPAISVLSAIEGLEVDAPHLGPAVLPLTLSILLALFVIQWKGTGFIGGIFGPIMLLWFVVLGILGIGGIARAPSVLAAVSPLYAVSYLLHAAPTVSFAVLGAVFLAVTGGEAMYADMGHFGRGPIRLAWFAVVLPGLVVNYLGQGALLLTSPEALENPFYLLAPDWAHYGLVAFATAAAVIASQAIISGVFSLTRQAIQLGFLPRMYIRHTASHERGQIYVPLVNWLLALATLGAVIGFGSSGALAGAYGIAVSLLMAITTVLAALVALQWGYNPLAVAAVNGFFLVIDLLYFAANSTKFFEGGWFPLLLAVSVAFLMLTWRTGQRLVEEVRIHLRQPEQVFVRRLLAAAPLLAAPPVRLPGAAIVLTAATSGIPLVLTHHVKHNRVLHERVLLVTVVTTEEPRVPEADRIEVVPVAAGISRLFLRYGFMESPDVSEALRLAISQGQLAGIDLDDVTYYLGRETIIPTRAVLGMALWREEIFAILNRNAERSAAYFCIPARQVVEIGIEIEI
jgi:KUP system potassium uptake protein